MTLIKWNNPLKGLGRQNQILPSFENLFNDYFNADFSLREFVSCVPAVNVSEKEDKYLIEVSAPGFNKDEFKVEIADGILTISGEHKEEKKKMIKISAEKNLTATLSDVVSTWLTLWMKNKLVPSIKMESFIYNYQKLNPAN